MPRGTPRTKTETHESCSKCDQMIPKDGFNKNQSICRQCQSARRRDRYSKGRKCSRCLDTPISDYAPGDLCRKCSLFLKYAEVPSRRTANPKSKYIVVTRQHDHPNADKRGRIYEHVLVMSRKLGRPLYPGESVHHLNGVRDDNRPENLELWTVSQPRGQRVSDKIAWAREILAIYDGVTI